MFGNNSLLLWLYWPKETPPSISDVTGIPAPVMVDGVAQKPIEGVSMAYTFDKANLNAPSPHHIQYFEMMGVQGLYNDGWMLL